MLVPPLLLPNILVLIAPIMLSAVTTVLASNEVGIGRTKPRFACTLEVLISSIVTCILQPLKPTSTTCPCVQPSPPCSRSITV